MLHLGDCHSAIAYRAINQKSCSGTDEYFTLKDIETKERKRHFEICSSK